MVKTGNRKFFAFVGTVVLFTAVVLVALFKHNGVIDMPTFAFQLASAYAILSGLFFGSNALVHLAGKKGEETSPPAPLLGKERGEKEI